MKQETMTQEQVLALMGKTREPATSLVTSKRKAAEPTRNSAELEPGVLHKITLPINMTNDNDGQSKHWSRTVKRKKEYWDRLRIDGHCRFIPFPQGVTLILRRILGPRQRLWDNDSILRGSAKQLIDALVDAGWFISDDNVSIFRVIGEQDSGRRCEGPAVEIRVCK